MAGFSLDEVRETYAADMTSFVGAIDTAAQALLSAQALSLGVPRANNGNSLFEALASYGHAIYGSSSLIGLQSMMSVSHALEDMASRGHEALAQLEAQVSQVRGLANLCETSASALRAMLELELQGKSDEARAIAATVVPRIASAVAPLPAAPGPEAAASEDAAREFDFEDDPPPPSADVNAELRGVFRDEVQTFVVTLQQQLRTLAAHPDDAVTAARVERTYHTLKGAAATVGLQEVAELASTLQSRFEDVADGRAEITPSLLGETLRLTNRLLRATELPEITLELSRPETAEADRSRTFFLHEARQIAAEAAALTDALASAGPERRVVLAKQLRRLFHGLKGSALVLGDHQVADLAVVLDGHAQAVEIGALRTALAALQTMIGTGAGSLADEVPQPASSALDERASAPISSAALGASTLPLRHPAPVTVGDDRELWDAFLQESQELLEAIDRHVFALEGSPTPRLPLQALFGVVHTLKGATSSVGLAPTAKVLHQLEDLLEQMTDAPEPTPLKHLVTLVLAAQAEVRLNLRQVTARTPGAALVVDSSQATFASWAAQVLAGGLERTSASSRPSDAAPTDDDVTDRRYLRVSAERLDELMNLAGELVVNRSRLLNRVGSLKSLHHQLGDTRRALFTRVDDFRRQYEFANLGGERRAPVAVASAPTARGYAGFSELELDRYDDVHILARSLAEVADDLTEMDGQIARELNQIHEDSDSFSFVVSRLQNEVTRTRMVSVDTLFARLRLPIRDAADQQTKAVEVRLSENEVSIDKTIVDALYKPMLHLVRNAVFHGLEPAAERVKAGKPESGKIELRARQEAGQIVIEIADDGRGLDLAALKEQGVRQGLISSDVPLDDPAVKELVFAPRLSTAASVGAVAGRGVGGEVVKRAVERLNGHIRVETTAGRGTVFSITLPMTLLITPALLFKSGGATWAVPLFFAERIIELEDREMVDVLGASQLKVGDRFVPVRRLETIFGQPHAPRIGPVVVLRIGDRRLAVQVDSLLVREEVVVKNMGQLLQGHPLFAGVTLRGDGSLVLILDVPGLMDHERVSDGQTRAPRPSTPASEVVLEAEPLTPEPAPSVALARPRVLFVDDSLSVRKVAERALLELGVEVTLAVDGRDALEKLRASAFDLIFTDLEMPRMHGFDLIREVRFLPQFRELPVVVISSRSGSKHQEQARSLGATEYLNKPFTPQVLEAVLARLLRFTKGA